MSSRLVDQLVGRLDCGSISEIVDCTPCSIFGLSCSGEIQWCNKAFRERSQYDKAELEQKSIFALCPDIENQERFRRLLLETESGKETLELDVEIRCGDFERLALTINSAVHRDADGRVSGAVCFGRDATRQRQLEEAAKQAAEEQRALFDLSSLPVFGVDHRGAVDVWNSRLAEITGVASEVSAEREYVCP